MNIMTAPGSSPRGVKMGEKIKVLSKKKIDFVLSKNFKFLSKQRKIQYMIMIFLKFIIPVRANHCDYLPQASKI
jgi:late competence protein required for DNA uptake (superfamily II DNA/RNA helicase)